MSQTFEQRLRDKHPIGPKWQNPQQIGVGDAVELELEPGLTLKGTVIRVRPYRERDGRPGVCTFVEISFDDTSVRPHILTPEWIDVLLVTKQQDALLLTTAKNTKDVADILHNVYQSKPKPTRSSGQILRTQRFANQKLVRMGSENVKGTIDMVLMGIPYLRLYKQFCEKPNGVGELCDVIEETLIEFFKEQ